MSVVAAPLPHHPFPDTDLFNPSGAASADAELPPPLQDIRPPLIPFPVFQHRHSSPDPMPQSFSALGPPGSLAPHALASVPPPPAPKRLPVTLPGAAPDGSDLTMQSPLPPTPESSPPNNKVLSPTKMVKLAPPAEGSKYHLRIRDEANEEGSCEGTTRRLSISYIETLSTESPPSSPAAGLPLRLRTQSQLQNPTPRSDTPPLRPKSTGPGGRPIRWSHTAIHLSSIRMSESQSADSRVRLRSTAAQAPPHSSGQVPSFDPRPSLVFPRTVTEPVVTPDLGGADGLEAKVVLLGSQGVGKTSLILRYTTRLFSPSSVAATIGSSLHTRKLVHSGIRVKLQIWDTAGQERFRSMAPIYYRGAHVCVLVYDISDRASFEDVRSWLEELSKTVPKETVIFVVGSKVDLEVKRAVRYACMLHRVSWVEANH